MTVGDNDVYLQHTYRAECTCGWKGRDVKSERSAWASAGRHMDKFPIGHVVEIRWLSRA